jgi:DNA-binding transcriptional ArsR family regulator
LVYITGERSAGEFSAVVQEEFGISQPGVSQHLDALGTELARGRRARRLGEDGIGTAKPPAGERAAGS